jgi:hypothetical protein
MTQDEIIEMARKAGLYQDINVSFHQALRNFYDLATERTWVGLTDDEMEATFIECGGKWNGDFWKIEDADFHPFLRTIEAKLKEKNNG